MTVIVDIGNCAVKVAHANNLGYPDSVLSFGLRDIESALVDSLAPSSDQAIVASSGKEATLHCVVQILQKKNIPTIVVNQNGPLPFISAYAAGQAGIDRLANVAAAIELGKLPAIVIDAGTAITVEVIGREPVFLGGAILPGIQLQADALHAGTARLPKIQFTTEISVIATDTDAAIQTGIVSGCAGAIDRLVQTIKTEPGMAEASLILTGGDALLFGSLVQTANVNVVPNLTLRGLYLLARHQNPDILT